jgi:putative phosphoesterase
MPMKRIGLLSDTHSFLDKRVFEHFKDVDEIWHAGDIGRLSLTDELEAFKPLRAVYGNIDGQEIRSAHPLDQRFTVEEVKVFMTHIGGYPGRYNRRIYEELTTNTPDLFISGHSHILKVMNDKKLGLLHMNSGACGKVGFHKVRTLLRFTIDGKRIKDLDVIELETRK